MPSSLPLSSHS
jgi:hypothetical protein